MSEVAVLEVLLGLCFSNFGMILYLSLPFLPFKTGRKSLLSHFFVETCFQGLKIANRSSDSGNKHVVVCLRFMPLV